MSHPIHVVCPECDAVNRVPRDRLGAGANGRKCGIRSIPTLVLFKDGREVTRTTGALDADRLVTWIRQWL